MCFPGSFSPVKTCQLLLFKVVLLNAETSSQTLNPFFFFSKKANWFRNLFCYFSQLGELALVKFPEFKVFMNYVCVYVTKVSLQLCLSPSFPPQATFDVTVQFCASLPRCLSFSLSFSNILKHI